MRKIFILFVLSLAVAGCQKVRTYTFSLCAGCGRHRNFEKISGKVSKDDISETEISEWLKDYRDDECKHTWISYCGKGEGMYWDGESHWNTCLQYIKKIAPSIGDSATKELLERYYNTLEVPDQKGKWKKLEEFIAELKPKAELNKSG